MALNPTQEIVSHQLDLFHEEHYPKLTRGDAFTQFCATLALKAYQLDEPAIQTGIVDGKYDGGIDLFYTIVNKTESITMDSAGIRTKATPKNLQAGVPLDVVIVQAKSETSWDHASLWKLQETVSKLLTTQSKLSGLASTPLNPAVVNQIDALRRIEKKLVPLNPVRSFNVFLMCNAAEGGIHTHLANTRKSLEAAVKAAVPHSATVNVKLMGAESLEALIRAESNFSAVLKFSNTPIRERRGSSQAFLGLVTVKQYLEFLRRGKSSVLRDELFSVNVRDFAGSGTLVNAAIRKTLAEDSKTAFWWMNNGITVLADDASEPANDHWSLQNPQIVNGLQTSHVIHEADLQRLITSKRMKETILIRVVNEKDPHIRESIITGTNNQTNVGAVQLYANDDIQRRLEQFLLTKGWYYERRRWQYRNTGAPASKIRNIMQLGQAIMAVHLLEPDTARARPQSLLRMSEGYKRVFHADAPEMLYAKALNIMEAVETYLKTPAAQEISDDPANDRFYIASGYIVSSLGLRDIAAYDGWKSVNNIKDSPSGSTLKKVHAILYSLVPATDTSSKDKLFKGKKLKADFFEAIIAARTGQSRGASRPRGRQT